MNHEQVYKEYLEKNSPFFGVFGDKKKFFAIIDKDLNVLFKTDKVFTNGDFSKLVESGLRKNGISKGDEFNKSIRTDNSLLEFIRNIFVSTSLRHHSQKNKETNDSEQFKLFSSQINKIGVILDREEFNQSIYRKEKYDSYDSYIRSLYTKKGLDQYEEALQWESKGFPGNIIPFIEDL
jgi:nucleotidyltransferase/DNA polymerase involved in DNA repair